MDHSEHITLKFIGYARTPFQNRSDIPKGLGTRHTAEGILEILPEFEPGLLDIEGFSHLFVLWVFHQSDRVELIGSPPTDHRPHGVFATRSPKRPSPVGLTVVRLLERQANQLKVEGVDMLDGSPLLDIKPYLSGVDPIQLRRGWLEEAEKTGQSAEGSTGS